MNSPQIVIQEPVGYVSQRVIDWLSSNDRSETAYSSVNIYKNPCGFSDVPLYATQQPMNEVELLLGIASIVHCGGLLNMTVDDALTAIRIATLPYFEKDASNDKHRAIIAEWKERQNANNHPRR